ncbi:MAG: PSD1 and planctomycete cytochrome C domain-containing protein [Bacteroidota bacterium]
MRILARLSSVTPTLWWGGGVLICLLFGLILWKSMSNRSPELPQTVSFNQHVRPILSQQCYLCHGPDSSSRKADLRLDLREAAIQANGEGVAAIVPGKPHRSELLRRIQHHDPEIRMPPPEAKKILTETEIALLERWIDQGAEYEPHWAFVPPQTGRQETSIDNWIRKGMRSQGLTPAPAAEPSTLIRRVSYLLTGLPPDPAQLDRLSADFGTDEYEQLVDSLLASPRFGERWARHWMDLIRYAETKGHEFDYPIGGAWRYRDYLIRAFNEDIPYDQLIKEHLAGDLLPQPRLNRVDGRPESPIGTAYMTFSEGKHSPVDLIVDEAERIDNLIDVTTKTFQGLTVACARCHDHKFDPIPTTDYYSLYGIFKSTRFHPIPMGQTAAVRAAIEEMATGQVQRRQELAEHWLANLPIAQAVREEVPTDARLHPLSTGSLLGDFRDGSWGDWQVMGQAFGEKPTAGRFRLSEDQQQLESLTYPVASSRSLTTGMQGTLRSPDFVIEQDTLLVMAAGNFSSLRVVIDNFQLIQDPIYGELDLTVETEAFQAFTFPLAPWKGHIAYLEVIPGRFFVPGKGPRHLYRSDSDAWVEVQYAVAYDSIQPEAWFEPGYQPNLRTALTHWREDVASWADIDRLNVALKKGELVPPDWESIPESQMPSVFDSTHIEGVSEGKSIFSPVFLRGSPQQLTEALVPHRFFTALEGEQRIFAGPGSHRLELAEAMADPNNPLTARVMVNRIWHHLFGRGIVASVDNFGIQGKAPSHPELLDALAITFIEHDWSIKHLIREIVLSETFQRSSTPSEEAGKIDPQDVYLSHFPVRRLEAEAIRDAMLATSGEMDHRLYGPPVGVHLTEFMKGRGRPRTSGPLDGAGRRSIYLEMRRNFMVPMLQVFDQPMPFSTFGKRNVSNVPAQSLTLMNDPFVIQQAERWAEKVLQQATTSEARLEQMYQRAFFRSPSVEERQQSLAFLQQQAQLLGCSESDGLAEIAVWQALAHALFNSKEFIFVR